MNVNVNIGVFVSEVMLEFVVEDVGIEVGDIIIEVNGCKINSFFELCVCIFSMGVGVEVELMLFCKGEEVIVEVVLGDVM